MLLNCCDSSTPIKKVYDVILFNVVPFSENIKFNYEIYKSIQRIEMKQDK